MMDPVKLQKISDGLSSCASRLDALCARRADAQGRDPDGKFASNGGTREEMMSTAEAANHHSERGKFHTNASKTATGIQQDKHRRAAAAHKIAATENRRANNMMVEGSASVENRKTAHQKAMKASETAQYHDDRTK